MNSPVQIKDMPIFDAAQFLDDEESIAAFLSDVLASGDEDLFKSALADVAKARGMTEIARESGISRESLYKALRPGANPRFSTISHVLTSLGVRLVIAPGASQKA